MCKTEIVCGFYSQNYAPGGFNFRALLTEGGAERLELVREPSLYPVQIPPVCIDPAPR